jgi:hypothetical protein
MKTHEDLAPTAAPVTVGKDEKFEAIALKFPDAIAAANRQIASMAGSPTLIARLTAEELEEDRSGEMAIVGKLKK